MPITVVGGSAADQQRVEDAADEVIIRLWQVTAGWLRARIQTRATTGTVILEECEDPLLLGDNVWHHYLWGLYTSKDEEIHICINNIGNNDDLLADVMLHEWAHSCCWSHGDNHGVPGNDGAPP
ncbi:hypothetical protein [Candidatus Entotheonella palauensis]|uniref:SprT-like domain-containing protein n=1 Tax=Candidatus Entotheonella gemina TaxID=1429439 RepID=W4MEW8_9BACT|nr:hypothetical protein [Candidatus Entotheonella palauensis]ETX08466.1 MAG: hypothetical protein ETSY2_05250 [Candidatus Entotheonella gemina]